MATASRCAQGHRDHTGSNWWLAWWLSGTKLPTPAHQKGQGDLCLRRFRPEDRLPRQPHLPPRSGITVHMRPVPCAAHPDCAGHSAGGELRWLRAPGSVRPPPHEATSWMWDEPAAGQSLGQGVPVGDRGPMHSGLGVQGHRAIPTPHPDPPRPQDTPRGGGTTHTDQQGHLSHPRAFKSQPLVRPLQCTAFSLAPRTLPRRRPARGPNPSCAGTGGWAGSQG